MPTEQQFDMADPPARLSQAELFSRTESCLVELDGLFGALGAQIGEDFVNGHTDSVVSIKSNIRRALGVVLNKIDCVAMSIRQWDVPQL